MTDMLNNSNSIQVGVRAIVPSAEGIVVVEHQEKADQPFFFVLPGGGVENGESLFEATTREVAEETNLHVVPERIVYLREVKAGESSGIEFYVLCQPVSEFPRLGHDPELAKGKQILKSVKVAFGEELVTNGFYPEELRGVIAKDLGNNFPEFRNLGTHVFHNAH
ncbi:MAG: NUDIX hydrolase [Candidatus Kerfeldbacteria bacterium]|nr:NUDIX hydrolase [Candidatus Kerfeldbacteria bacterium]